MALREGVLMPDRPTVKGMPRLNTTAVVDARRAKLRTSRCPPPKPLQPTIGPVAQIVPQEVLAKHHQPT